MTELPNDTPRLAFIYEDHTLFGKFFEKFLTETHRFSRVLLFTDENQLKQYVKSYQDYSLYIFVDYFIRHDNSYHLITFLRSNYPDAKLILVSSLLNPALVKRLTAAGVNAFLSKMDDEQQVLKCLDLMESGQLAISSSLVSILSAGGTDRTVDFSAREIEIISRIAKGLTIEEIAAVLGISKFTVMTHRRNIVQRSRCNSIYEVIALAIETGILPRS